MKKKDTKKKKEKIEKPIEIKPDSPKKPLLKRKKLQKNLRRGIITFIFAVIIISAYSSYMALKMPITKPETTITCEYNHAGEFSYTVYLEDNSLYNKSTLLPGEGIIFKKLTDRIDASFSYKFTCDRSASSEGTYEINALIKSDLWEKNYVLVPLTIFHSKNGVISFTTTFPINTTYFEEIVSNINEETGVSALDPTLVITCKISLSAETDRGTILETFSPYLSTALNTNIIEIEGDLSQFSYGFLTGTEQVVQQNRIYQRDAGLVITIICIVILLIVIVFTENEIIEKNKSKKTLGKIKKKYGEWIVEVEKPPKRPLGSELVYVNSLEDLIKVSEELGKPILYHKSLDAEEQHIFYVLDENFQYKYVLNGKT